MPLISVGEDNKKTLILWEMRENISDYKALLPEHVFSSIVNNTKLEKRKLEKFSQQMLLKSAGVDSTKLLYHPNGKPFLSTGEHISFSHSQNLSALLIDINNCGLDLEYPSDKIIRISSKFINQKEAAFVSKEEEIYWAWCIKEAVFKFFGERVLFKDHITINDLNPSANKAIVLYDGYHGKGEFEMKLQWVKNYYLAYTKSFTPQ